jgi:Mn2+/Fe2+ NRAMP family transporter
VPRVRRHRDGAAEAGRRANVQHGRVTSWSEGSRRRRSSERHHPARRRLRGFGYFRRLGPGFVTGAADDDPAGIGTYSKVGATFRFDLVWTALISLPLASAVQETAARLGLTSGRGLMSLIKDGFARPVLWFAAVLVVGANVFNIGADLGSMAEAFRLLIPAPFAVLVVAMAGTILLLEIFVSYDRYSLILRWLALSIFAYVVELFVVDVDWSQVAAGLIPGFQPTLASVEALVAIFGTTISPYLFVWQAGEEVEERKAGRIGRVDASQIRVMRVDVVSGMSAGVLVMFAIMVSSAATLGAHGSKDVQTAAEAARALEPIAGRFASALLPPASSARVCSRSRRSRDRRRTHWPRRSVGARGWDASRRRRPASTACSAPRSGSASVSTSSASTRSGRSTSRRSSTGSRRLR